MTWSSRHAHVGEGSPARDTQTITHLLCRLREQGKAGAPTVSGSEPRPPDDGVHVVRDHRRGPQQAPYCVRCSDEHDGVRYLRVGAYSWASHGIAMTQPQPTIREDVKDAEALGGWPEADR